MKKASVAIVLTALLIMSCVVGMVLYVLYQRELSRNAELTARMEKLTEQESRSAVMQSINAQMEEIAVQERRVSDRQREEAIQQRHVAEEERRNAERQRREAEEQRQIALTAERKAIEASDLAQRQRTIAEQQRAEAEYSKRVADTLSYIAMARNLATLAVTQKTAGNEQLANLLAYTAYQFTNRYNGDVYNSVIYQALSLTSMSTRRWNVGRGAIMKMWFLPNDEALISVTTYGEILKHTRDSDGNLHTQALMQNSAYDFRDMVITDDGTLYALSHTGHIVYGTEGNLRVALIEGAQKPFRLFRVHGGQLLVVANQSIHLIDTATMQQGKMLTLNFSTTVAGETDKNILLFDLTGHAYIVDSKAMDVKAKPLPFPLQPIMSYAYNWRNENEAFGTTEGTIFVNSPDGRVLRLVGHRSRVSRVKFDGERLYSTSYDGTMRFWPVTQQKIEPMTIIDSHQWVVSFIFDEDMSSIMTGDQNGNLTETLIDAHLMAKKVRGKLEREFTPEEWEYYVGRGIPYRKLKIDEDDDK